MGTVLRFPTLYRIAWTDGEREGLLDGYEFRNKKLAEMNCRLLQRYYPTALLWVYDTRTSMPGAGDLPPAA